MERPVGPTEGAGHQSAGHMAAPAVTGCHHLEVDTSDFKLNVVNPLSMTNVSERGLNHRFTEALKGDPRDLQSY